VRRYTVRQGESLTFRAKAVRPSGDVLKAGQGTVRVRAWRPGERPPGDQQAAEVTCSYDARARAWTATLHTSGWNAGTWYIRADADGGDARGLDEAEVEVT
jgi:hypothetical protein